MLNSLENPDLFSANDMTDLAEIGLTQYDSREKLAALLLAPVLELARSDDSTSPSEFEAVEGYIRTIERQFELATKEELESIGTDMGLVPMLPATWDKLRFRAARQILARVLDRIDEDEAHAVRNAISKALLEVARARGGHFISLPMVSEEERPLIYEIVRSLKLDRSSEGLHLLGKSRGV